MEIDSGSHKSRLLNEEARAVQKQVYLIGDATLSFLVEPNLGG
jgi:hypothetical protein